ncbi:alpha/beta hydrolase family protein [Silvibacterium sp.]|uniref:alpha/beta hydrolase family protein n=1 Tax=Silvibacterium sp. TaxID=1964179 RepID=UPI0039E23682
MRLLEVVLVALLGASGLLLFRRTRTRGLQGWLVVAELLVLLLHAAIEGPHWQMAPAYLAALILPLAVPRLLRLRRWLGATILLLLLGSIAASWAVPMFRLPAPTGPFGIGTRVLEVVNPHPADDSSAGPNSIPDARHIVIQLWYPARKHSGARAAYRRLKETELESTYQAVLWTHARWNAPPAAAPMPVLLLNPAWNGRRTYYTYLAEDLASHGYMVVGIDHTGNSGPTLFADGHVGKPDPDPKLDFSERSFAELDAYGGQQVAVWADDNRFVLDALTSWNADPASPFYRQLDLASVGALGHSFGGAAAVETARSDPRVKAAVDYDGSFWGPQVTAALGKPMMMIEEDIGNPTPEELKDPVTRNDHLLDLRDAVMLDRSHALYVSLHGSTHASFTDRSLYSPLRSQSWVGSIPAYREYAILRALTLAFFDQTLRGRPSPLMDGQPHPFPEVTVTQR